ncbi:MAG: zinc ribbon domain-containing protein [Synergistaceae bacterium]|nr:zinc ribbon domain-containing protein [Synergistaceae bacterium]
MNCKHCGAPIEANDEVCQYCGKLTDYGEHMLEERRIQEQEDERRRALENLPVMKYVSVLFAAVIYIFTACGYSVWWYAMRIAPLNALGTKKKFPVWALLILAVSWAGMILLPGGNIQGLPEELSGEIYNYAFGVAFVASIFLAFSVRGMLQEYASGLMEKTLAVNTIAPSGIMLILFGPLYLQHSINKMIAMKLLAPKI